MAAAESDHGGGWDYGVRRAHMTEGYRVPGFRDGVVVHYLYRLPTRLSVSVSFQHEASGEHYIRRGEPRRETHVQGEWMKRLDGTEAYFGEDIRKGMIDLEKHRELFEEHNPGFRILGHAGAGNVTMNPYYLAWVRGRLGYTNLDIPNLESGYAFDGLVVFEDWHVEHHDAIQLGSGQEGAPTDVPILLGGSDESSRVRCAIIGPSIVRGGKAVSEAELERQVLNGEHYDLRHVMLFPHLRWNERKDAQVPQDPADVISFCPLLEAMWEHEKLSPAAIRAVFGGSPIETSTEPYDNPSLEYVGRIGRTIGTQTVVDALVGRGYVPTIGKPTAVGEFSLSGPTAGNSYRTLEVRIRPGIYNFSSLGVTERQEVIWGCTTGLGGRVGITVCQMGELMARAGCEHAILLDQGGDVTLRLGERQIVQSSYGRKGMRGVLFFVDPRSDHEPADVGVPSATTLPMRPIADLQSWVG